MTSRSLVVLVLLATRAFSQGPVFATSVESRKLKPDGGGNEEKELIVPTATKIKFGWTDDRFALHVPFDIPQGQRSEHELTITVTGPMKKGDAAAAPPPVGVDSLGFYRTDDQLVSEKKGTQVIVSIADFRLQGTDWQNGNGIAWGRSSRNLAPQADRKPPLINVTLRNSPSATRGVLWIVPSLPAFSVNELLEHAAEIKVEVTFVRSRTLRADGRDYDPLPLPPAATFKFKIRENGWAPTASVTVKRSDDWTTPYSERDRNDAVLLDASPTDVATTNDGRKVVSQVRIDDKGPKRHPSIDRRWDVELPERIWDFSQSDPLKVKLTRNKTPLADAFTAWVYKSQVPEKDRRIDVGVHDASVKADDGSLLFYYKGYGYQAGAPTQPVKEPPNLAFTIAEGANSSNLYRWTKLLAIPLARLSDIEKNVDSEVAKDPAGPKKEEADDGYWAWRLTHVEKVEEADARFRETRLAVAMAAKARKEVEAQWRSLYRAELATELPADIADAGSPPAPTVNREQLWYAQSAAGPARRREREALAAMAQEIRAGQQRHVDEMLAEMEALVASAEAQLGKSNASNKETVQFEVDRAKDTAAIAKLDLYDSAGWYEPNELPRLVQELGITSAAAPAIADLYRAKSLLGQAEALERRAWLQEISPQVTRTDEPKPPETPAPLREPIPIPVAPVGATESQARAMRTEAMQILRGLLKADADHVDAGALLVKEELELLRRILVKLDRERHLSLDQMGAYLSNRGYDVKEPKDWPGKTFEVVKVFFGTGPITLSTALGRLPEGWPVIGGLKLPFANVPEERAAQLGATQDAIARDVVSILVIMRLRRQDVPLDRIPTLTQTEFIDALDWVTEGGAPLDPAKAERMRLDVVDTYASIPELRALAAGDMSLFWTGLGASLFASLDTERTMAEWLGDEFLSPRHLLLAWGPTAILRVNGRWQYFSTPGMRTALLGGAEVERVSDAVIKTLRIDRLAEMLSKNKWATAFARDLGIEGGYTAAKAAAFAIALAGAQYSAQSKDQGVLAWLIEAFAEAGGDEFLYKAFHKTATPINKMAKRVEALAKYADDKKRELELLRRALRDVEDATNELKRTGERLSDEAAANLAANLPVVAQKAPVVTNGAGARHAVQGWFAAIRQGDLPGAVRALRAANDFLDRGIRAAERNASKMQRALAALSKSSPARNVPRLGDLPKILDIDQPGSFLADFALYNEAQAGRLMLAADKALQEGNLKLASLQYRAARTAAQAYAVRTPNVEALTKALEARLALVSNARRVRDAVEKVAAGPRIPAAARAILKEETERIGADLAKGAKLVGFEGGLNKIFRFTDAQGEHWIVKLLNDPEEFHVEIAGALLANEIGLAAPAARRIELKTVTAMGKDPATGEVLDQLVAGPALLSRDVVGLDFLNNFQEPVVVALKGEWAKQRALRAWLGDGDGHLANQLLGHDGNWHVIDFGMGNVGKKLSSRQAPRSGAVVSSTEEFVRWSLDYSKQIDHDSYRWMNRLDQMVHFDEMKSVVDKIEGLCANDAAGLRAVLSQGLEGQALEDAIEVLVKRQRVLRQELLERFPAKFPTTRLDAPKRREAVAA
jgi:hypothetical protein